MTNERAIFISHSSVDEYYGLALKNLLETLMPNQNFSSVRPFLFQRRMSE